MTTTEHTMTVTTTGTDEAGTRTRTYPNGYSITYGFKVVARGAAGRRIERRVFADLAGPSWVLTFDADPDGAAYWVADTRTEALHNLLH